MTRAVLRPILVLLLGLAVPALLPAQDEDAQLVVISAHADRASGTLVVTGLDFGDEPPRVTLGVDDLEVLDHSQGRVEAELPPAFPAGSYLLIVARGPAIAEYDVFHVAVPELPVRTPEPVAAAAGARGPMGPQGPAGPPGPAGPAARADLAGRRCPPGSYLAGFDAAGDLACESLPAPAAAADLDGAPGASPTDAVRSAAPEGVATGGRGGAAPRSAAACAVDASAAGADLPAAWGPRVPVLAEYPALATGELRGSFGGDDAADLLAVAAAESRGGFCLDGRDRPLVARLELEAPAGAALCACWSRLGEACSLSRNRCAAVAAGSPAALELPMAMLCGSADAGFLEVEVRPAPTAGCSDWQLSWQIAE
jgi:hypothetical protein